MNNNKERLKKIDWYQIESDLRREVFEANAFDIEGIKKRIDENESVGGSDLPPKTEKSYLKKLKKSELIELILECDENLRTEIDGTEERIKERVGEELEDLIEYIENDCELVLDCLKRTFEHMESFGGGG